MKNISILLPYQSDNGPRDRAIHWVKKFYEVTMPEAELCIGLSSGGHFNCSQALNDAAKMATREIFVLADGDVVYDPAIIEEAVKFLDHYPWVIPYRGVVNLSQDNTDRLLATEPTWPLNTSIDNYSINNFYERFGGKLMVMRRETFIAAGGYDERFVGWGGEDDALIHALETLCGPYKKLENQLIHFWHPITEWGNAPNAKDNMKLLIRYDKANGNKEAMLRLIGERRRPGSRRR
ncbi:galactosyltransferase-related protein [Neobacillus sp. NPDC093127]|uniref:galactosyltransferase-related protein n=1 Tax=Neobacillus sp. NPDC093127 TaxID=3364296 RepID=UPI0038191A10